MYNDHDSSNPSPAPATSSGLLAIKPADAQPVPAAGSTSVFETDVKIDDLIIDPALQMRVKPHDPEYVSALMEVIPTGKLPPIEVFRDPANGSLRVADGHARVAAAKQAGRTTIRAWIHPGGRREAFMFALGANATHGARRTNADLRHAVLTALADADTGTYTNIRIAELCQCSDHYVWSVRNTLAGLIGNPTGARRTGKDGKSYPASRPRKTAVQIGAKLASGPSVSGPSPSESRALESAPIEEVSAADILGGPGARVATPTPHEGVVKTTVAARRGEPTEAVAGELYHAATPSSDGKLAAVLGPRKAVRVPLDTPPHFPKAPKPKKPFSLLLKILRETSHDVWAALDNGQLDEMPDEDFLREIFASVRLCLGTLEESFPNEATFDWD